MYTFSELQQTTVRVWEDDDWDLKYKIDKEDAMIVIPALILGSSIAKATAFDLTDFDGRALSLIITHNKLSLIYYNKSTRHCNGDNLFTYSDSYRDVSLLFSLIQLMFQII